MRRRTLYAWLLATFAALCSACGGGGGSSASTTSYIRLVNASQAGNFSLSASTTTENSGVTSGNASGYAAITAGSYSIVVSDATANAPLSTSATSTLGLAADVYYTVVAYARGGQIKLLTITDNKTAPATGFASMTIANADQDAGALDVYVVAPGSSIDNLAPTFSNVTSTGVSLTNSITAGTYDIIVTAYNKSNDVRLTMSSVVLTSTEIVTLALTSTDGGSLVNGALVQQQAGVQLKPANKARVRVVGALPAASPNAVVSTTIGGTTLSSITAPSVGTYTLVDAGATIGSLTVSGTSVTAPTSAFASGGDYTLLVYGADASSATARILTDNNQLPTSGAKIRLVNGAVSSAGISLSDNFVPLFSELGYGTASDYSGVTAGSSTLSLTSAVSSFATYTITPNILSSGVYTLFVLGSTNATNVIFIKDK